MLWYESLDKQLNEYLPDLELLCDEPMSRHTSFRIGGPAKRMAYPSTIDEFTKLMKLAHACEARPLVIGNGTNLLAPDEGLDRLVIDTSVGMTQMEVDADSCTITAECGISLAKLAECGE